MPQLTVRRKALPAAPWAEQRDGRRDPLYRVGSATFAPGRRTNCKVFDQSHSGLRLELEGDCPEEFALVIPLRFDGVVRTAWRTEKQIGVSILRRNDARDN